MIFNQLIDVLLSKTGKGTKLKFDTIRNSPYRFAGKRNLRNRGLTVNPF